MDSISADSSVTIGLLITIMGGVIWLTKMWVQSKDNAKAIEELSEAHEKSVNHVRERLTRVETENSHMLDRMARVETKIDLVLDAIKNLTNKE